jgi:hypothetical protein
MKDIIDKISSYNIFNYLLPGIIFVIISNKITDYNFLQDDNVLGAFLYYFIGMVISRVGSIIIEPILKKISFVKFSDYKDFVLASKKDEKIELLSEVNNTYRTLSSTFFLIGVLKAYNLLQIKFLIPETATLSICLLLILTMFLFSYKKQTNYITKRIKANS